MQPNDDDDPKRREEKSSHISTLPHLSFFKQPNEIETTAGQDAPSAGAPADWRGRGPAGAAQGVRGRHRSGRQGPLWMKTIRFGFLSCRLCFHSSLRIAAALFLFVHHSYRCAKRNARKKKNLSRKERKKRKQREETEKRLTAAPVSFTFFLFPLVFSCRSLFLLFLRRRLFLFFEKHHVRRRDPQARRRSRQGAP